MNEPELNECTHGFLRQIFINYRIGLKRADFDLVIRPLFWPSLVQKSVPIKLGSSLTSRTFSKGGISLSRNDSFRQRFLSLNRGKKSKTRDHHRACFADKNPELSIELICICFCALDFFPQKWRSVLVPKNADKG